MEWTTERPKVEGIYWIYRSTEKHPEVIIGKVANKFNWPIDELKPVESTELECWSIDEEYAFPLSYFTHWLGPLEVPAPPTG